MSIQGIIVAGVSGCGKTTVARDLCAKFPNFCHLRAVTTRPERPSDAGEYQYLSSEEFMELKANDQLMVYAQYGQSFYGISKYEWEGTLAAGRVPVLTITPESYARTFGLTRENVMFGNTPTVAFLSLFLDAKDDVLDERLKGRDGTLHAERIERRRLDRSFKRSFSYDLHDVSAARAVELIEALWSHRNSTGVMPARLIKLLIGCGTLLGNAVPENIAGASYDLRVGDEVFFGGHLELLSESSPIHLIEPYDYAIVKSAEIARLPADVSARFDLSVGKFCQGVILSNGPQVDPGFTGPLFCLLFNTSSSPVMLRRGRHYATIEFQKLMEPTFRYAGEYLGKSLVDYLPANAAQGAINQLKKEVEKVREDSSKLQNLVITIIGLILAFIAVWVTIIESK